MYSQYVSSGQHKLSHFPSFLSRHSYFWYVIKAIKVSAASLLRLSPSPLCHICPGLLISHICTFGVIGRLDRPQTLRDWLPDRLMLLYWAVQRGCFPILIICWFSKKTCLCTWPWYWRSCVLCLGFKTWAFDSLCVPLLGPILSYDKKGCSSYAAVDWIRLFFWKRSLSIGKVTFQPGFPLRF